MSDGSTNSDEKADAMDKPMENPEVDVKVRPVQKNLPKRRHSDRDKVERENDSNNDVARKVKENVKKVVKDAVKKAGEKPGATRQDQYDAAKDAAENESAAIPRRRIKEFQVTVGDEHHTSSSEHEAGEGPPPDTSDD